MDVEGFGFVNNTQAFNFCSVFFGRLGIWFLIGPSLAQFCCNRKVVVGGCIHIGIYGISAANVISRFDAFNVTLQTQDGDCVVGSCYGCTYKIYIFTDFRKGSIACAEMFFPKSWLMCNEETCREIQQKNPHMSLGMWRIPLSEKEAIEFRLPYMIGSVLDAWNNRWWGGIEHDPEVWCFNDVFFDTERSKNAVELIGQMYDCGKKAGIDHAMFLGYGTLLGAIRQGDFIPSDRDMDMCIVANWITVSQANAYVDACKAAGLGEHRWVTPQCRTDTGMPLWFSLGPKNPVSESGIKSCNWFWFSHGGYWWHSKGGMWVSPTKFSPKKTQYNSTDAAIAKGIPITCLTKLSEAEFHGIPVRYPDNVGACLDHFYPCWPVPREGASAHEWIMVVEKWEDKNTWRIG